MNDEQFWNLDKGIMFDDSHEGNKWRVRRRVDGRMTHFGWYATKEDAQQALLELCRKDPRLIRLLAEPVDRCCEDAPIGRSLCAKHYSQKYSKEGFRFIPNRPPVKRAA